MDIGEGPYYDLPDLDAFGLMQGFTYGPPPELQLDGYQQVSYMGQDYQSKSLS